MDTSIAYVEDGVVVVRASGAGNCLRALWAAATGSAEVVGPEWLMQTAREGQLHEPDVLRRLREDGIGVTGGQKMVNWEVVPKKVVIRGHVDGELEIVDPRDAPGVVEVKSMSQNVFESFDANRWESKPTYAWQLSCYMFGYGAERALYAYKNRNTGELKTFWVEKPPVDRGTVTRKMVDLARYVESGVMPDCGEDVNRFFCPFPYLHDEWGDEPVDLSGDTALDEMAGEYVEISEQIKKLEVQKRDLRNGMVSLVGPGGKVITDTHKIGVNVKSRSGVSVKKIEAEMGKEWVEKFRYKTEYEEVRVTRR